MYHLVKHSYRKEDEAGRLKTHKEQILIETFSYTDTEATFYSFIEKQGANGIVDRSIDAISPIKFNDFGGDNGGKWYRVKSYFISVDERSGKEKRIPMNVLVNAHTPEFALSEFDSIVKDLLVPIETDGVTETKILEVIHKKKE